MSRNLSIVQIVRQNEKNWFTLKCYFFHKNSLCCRCHQHNYLTIKTGAMITVTMVGHHHHGHRHWTSEK